MYPMPTGTSEVDPFSPGLNVVGVCLVARAFLRNTEGDFLKTFV